jgi:hypothetical protein
LSNVGLELTRRVVRDAREVDDRVHGVEERRVEGADVVADDPESLAEARTWLCEGIPEIQSIEDRDAVTLVEQPRHEDRTDVP